MKPGGKQFSCKPTRLRGSSQNIQQGQQRRPDKQTEQQTTPHTTETPDNHETTTRGTGGTTRDNKRASINKNANKLTKSKTK